MPTCRAPSRQTRAIVHPDRAGRPTEGRDALHRLDHLLALDAPSDLDGDRFAGVGVDDGEGSQPPAIEHGVWGDPRELPQLAAFHRNFVEVHLPRLTGRTAPQEREDEATLLASLLKPN